MPARPSPFTSQSPSALCARGHDVCSNISVEKGKVSGRHADEDKIDRDVDAGGWHPQANLTRVVAAEEVENMEKEVVVLEDPPPRQHSCVAVRHTPFSVCLSLSATALRA
jgi:hypothetical protein